MFHNIPTVLCTDTSFHPLCASNHGQARSPEHWLQLHIQHRKATARDEDREQINRIEEAARNKGGINAANLKQLSKADSANGGRCCEPLWTYNDSLVKDHFRTGRYLEKARHIPQKQLQDLAQAQTVVDDKEKLRAVIMEWNQRPGAPATQRVATSNKRSPNEMERPDAHVKRLHLGPEEKQDDVYSGQSFSVIDDLETVESVPFLNRRGVPNCATSRQERADPVAWLKHHIEHLKSKYPTKQEAILQLERKVLPNGALNNAALNDVRQLSSNTSEQVCCVAWSPGDARVQQVFGDMNRSIKSGLTSACHIPFGFFLPLVERTRKFRQTEGAQGCKKDAQFQRWDIDQAIIAWEKNETPEQTLTRLRARRPSKTVQRGTSSQNPALDHNMAKTAILSDEEGIQTTNDPVSISPELQDQASLEKIKCGWLNDEVINATLKLVEDILGASKVKAVSSHTMSTKSPMVRPYQELGSATIVLPIHVTNHWLVAIIRSDRSLVTVYDSMRGDAHEQAAEDVVARFCALSHFGALPIHFASPLLQDRSDSTSCGVYALVNVLSFVTSTPLQHGRLNVPLWRNILQYLLQRSQPQFALIPPFSWSLRVQAQPWGEGMGNEATLVAMHRQLRDSYKAAYRQAALEERELREAACVVTVLLNACQQENTKARLEVMLAELKESTTQRGKQQEEWSRLSCTL